MIKNIQVLVLLFLFCNMLAFAQEKSWFNLSAEYGYFTPGNDLKNKYGNNSTIGGSAIYKTSNNLLISFNGFYLFSDKVKNKNSILEIINNDKGDLIDGNGEIAEIRYFERGMGFYLKIGKIFPIWQINKNSGPTISIGPGFFQHKTRIDNPENLAPQIVGDYKKGYDRLSNGVSCNQFIGYTIFSDNRIFNCFFGIEFVQAWTQNRRYDYNLMKKDNTKMFDTMWGVKAGWIIHFRRRVSGNIYI